MRSVTGCLRDREGEKEEGEGRMRDGWLTQSLADVWRGMGCPSIERAIRLTTLDLIDIPTESFPSANRHITLVCKLVAELPAAKGLLNIHEGAFKDVLQKVSSLHRRCRPLFNMSLQPAHARALTSAHSAADTRHAGLSQANPWPDEKLSRCS